MEDHHLPVNETLVLQGDFQRRSGSDAVKELLENRRQIPGRDIEALVCTDNYMALSVHEDLIDRGYHIPDDIAVVGFDDLILARCMIPALSSVYPPIKNDCKRF